MSNVKNSSSQVNEAMVNDVKDLKAMMREMMNEKNKARVCGICDSIVHATNECPHQYQEQSEEQVCGLWESNNHKPKANFNQSFNQQN